MPVAARRRNRALRQPVWSSLVLLGVLLQGCSTNENPLEPGVGTLEVSITVAGTAPDLDGYTVQVHIEGLENPLALSAGSLGGTVRFDDLQTGMHVVGLESLAPNCWVAGIHPRRFQIRDGVTTRIEFAVSCPTFLAIYNRVSPHDKTALDAHGSLTERYVFYDDSSFGLQFSSARFGFFEYPGTYSRVGSEIGFDFSSGLRWEAIGTLRGDSLVVAYNLDMVMADFENAVFVIRR